jgi:hypothetical protein
MDTETLPPSLQNVVDQGSLKRIFCGALCPMHFSFTTYGLPGGKGGVVSVVITTAHPFARCLPQHNTRRPRPVRSPYNSRNVVNPSCSSSVSPISLYSLTRSHPAVHRPSTQSLRRIWPEILYAMEIQQELSRRWSRSVRDPVPTHISSTP